MLLAIDTETTGIDLYHGCKPFFVSTCDEKGNQRSWEFEVDPLTRNVEYPKDKVRTLFNYIRGFDGYVFHNCQFDIKALSLIDPGLDEIILDKVAHDTLFSTHVLESNGPHGLKDLALVHLDILDDDEKDLHDAVIKARRIADKKGWLIAKYGNPHFPLLDRNFPYCDFWLPKTVAIDDGYPDDHPWRTLCSRYALRDAERTMLLWLYQQQGLTVENGWYHYQLEVALAPVLYRMQQRGVSLRNRTLIREIRRYRSMSRDHADKAVMISAIENLNSGPQLQKYLYEDLKLPVVGWTANNNPSTSAENLETLAEVCRESRPKAAEFLDALLSSRKANTAAKYLIGYCKACIKGPDGAFRIHANLNQTGTDTTRLSSSAPNLHNVGKGDEDDDKNVEYQLRSVYGPAPGTVWYPMDYSQLQLRIFAAASQEQSLIDAFEAGHDFHNFVACQIFKTDNPTKIERRVAKNVNFGLIFGGGANKIDSTAGMPGAYDLFRKQFPNVDKYMQSIIKQVRKTGMVRTLGGYPLQVPTDRAYAGVCYIVQGTEGEIVKHAMVGCDYYLESGRCVGGSMILQVHDELLFEFHKASTLAPTTHNQNLRELKIIMEQAGTLIGVETPVDVSIVKRDWASAEKYEIGNTK